MKNSLRSALYIIIFTFFLSTSYLKAQTIPYGANNSYSYGLMQTYQTNAAADANASTWYNYWKTNFTLACGAPNTNKTLAINGYGSSSAFSEGQGYGLLLAAYSGDKALFDELWEGYKDYKNANGVMDWTVNCTGSTAANGATDGDLDAAMALLIANRQWPSTTSPYNYATEATTLITAIRNSEFTTCSGKIIQKPGDMFGGCNCTNPSYYAVGYYRAFAVHVPSQAAFWNQAASDGYDILLAIQNATTGLVPAWTDSGAGLTGGSGDCNSIAASGGGARNEYQFDAARTPWRVLIDYLWWGTPQSKTFLDKMTGWVGTTGISNIVAGYKLNGTANVSYKNSAFTGAFAIGAMTSGNQTTANNFYDWWINHSIVSGGVGSNLDDNPYFQNTLRTLYAFVASGNFWNPYNGNCLQPNLGADLSTCSGTTLPATLNSNTTDPGSSVDYTWYRNGSVISGQTGPNCSNCGTVTGTYVVVRDSTGGCSKRDTLLISSSIPVPAITGPLVLCSPASYNLTPTNVASFPGGTTWQWAADYTGGTTYNNIIGETASTLSSVRRAGRYRLTALAGACTNNGNVVVTSSLATPVDGCVSGSGTTTVSITNPGLNGTNYNWYTTASGPTLATVSSGTNTNTTSITVNVGATTTYYVQDMSAVNTNVGPTTVLGSGNNWGVNAGNHLHFTANSNFTLNSFRVPFGAIHANDAAATITVEILDGTGAAFTPAKIFTSNPVNITTAMANSLITYNFTGFNIQSAWGPALRMRVTAVTTNGEMHWSNGPASYPYNSAGGIVSITGKSGGNGGANEYMYFYNWNISTGSPCDRLPVTVRTTGCTPAPVELVSFYADQEQGRTILSWTTASELNNDYFNVERSLDGENFYVIGTVDGMGTKQGVTLYSFADENAVSGKVYYRLIQVDYDGQQNKSFVISVESDNSISKVEIAPNPFSHSTQILVTSKETTRASVKITDLSGLLVYSGSINTNEYQNVGEFLPSGVYLLQIFIGNNKTINKILKQ